MKYEHSAGNIGIMAYGKVSDDQLEQEVAGQKAVAIARTNSWLKKRISWHILNKRITSTIDIT